MRNDLLTASSVDALHRSTGIRLLFGSVCTASGAFIILLHLGIVPWRRVGRCRAVFCDSYHWPVLCFGIAIVAAGLLFYIPPGRPRIGGLCALAAVATFGAALIGTFASM